MSRLYPKFYPVSPQYTTSVVPFVKKGMGLAFQAPQHRGSQTIPVHTPRCPGSLHALPPSSPREKITPLSKTNPLLQVQTPFHALFNLPVKREVPDVSLPCPNEKTEPPPVALGQGVSDPKQAPLKRTRPQFPGHKFKANNSKTVLKPNLSLP